MSWVRDHLGKAVLSTVAGCLFSGLLSWWTFSLTVVGRVQAIESSLSRIEQRLDNMATKDHK